MNTACVPVFTLSAALQNAKGLFSTITLPVFQCSATTQLTRWDYLFSVVALGEFRICSIRKLDLSLLALHRRSCPETWQS